MKLNLQKPLVVFDLETTGLDLVKDRIIQISYIKVYPDGKEERGDELINPERPIPQLVTELTGISDDDVKDKPTFKELAQTIADKFTGCDFDSTPITSMFLCWLRSSCVPVSISTSQSAV